MKKWLLFFLWLFCFYRGFSQTAPDFTFTDTDSNVWNLYTELDKGKTVLLDFFYVNCVPCQTLTPEIVQVNNDYGAGNERLLVFGISDRDNNQSIKQFDSNLGVNYPSCGNEGGGDTITSLYMSWFSFIGWPTYAVVCPDKSIVWNLPKSEGLPEIRAAIDNCHDLTSNKSVNYHSGFLIYPIPANEELYLKTEIKGFAEIRLYNSVSGKEVFFKKQELSAESISIPLTELNSGMYILMVKTANEQFVFKIPVIK
jgi:thiol-disulfide isomerase/thioredoxin